MHHHPLWCKTVDLLSNGTTFPIHPISDSSRRKDLAATLEYGNHKSVKTNHINFVKNMTYEIKHGWFLPLPPNFAFHHPHAEVAPHGIVSQHTITENGEIVDNVRVTNKQSYPGLHSKKSIKSRVIYEYLAACMFEYMHLRCIHYIIGFRQRHPSLRIWMSKIDYKSEYQCQHFNAKTVTKSLK